MGLRLRLCHEIRREILRDIEVARQTRMGRRVGRWVPDASVRWWVGIDVDAPPCSSSDQKPATRLTWLDKRRLRPVLYSDI